ncbi:MAG: S9 family peptidase, partial [Terriglobales bacterium]
MARHTLLILALAAGCAAAQTPPRPLTVNDMSAIRTVTDPQCSPDGRQVAYVVRSVDVKKDSSESHIWIASYDGASNTQWTESGSSASSPRWSPDGKFLAFTSSRPGDAEGNQVWLLPRQGGEAVQLTNVAGSLGGFYWSPDSKQLALVVTDPSEATLYKRAHHGQAQPPQPITITRYLFEADGTGYLTERKTHIYVFDIASKKLTRVTAAAYSQSNPAWSPDSRRIAFFSNHDPHPDREYTGQLYVSDVRPGAVAQQLTPENFYAAGQPAWSPDGRWIAFTKGTAPKIHMYSMPRLAIVAADGSGAPRVLNPAFDRDVAQPQFTADGRSIEATVTDDRSEYPARFSLADGSETGLLPPPIVSSGYTSAGNCQAAVVGYPDKANEIYAVAD